MSTVIDFFVAPDDTSAATALRARPGPARASLSLGNFDVEEAVVEWECLLVGGTFTDLVEAGEPRTVADRDEDECLVFALSPRLCAALAAAGQPRLRDVAVSWVDLRARDGEVFDPETAHGIVAGLAALAGSAGRREQGVYCRVG
ncbi:hypothetical protein [Streptomyces sp. WM6386]|uniref:hypothetical protein n=1 Tax=Streptomyces sp. WM6386 TaxID=1415558 RepID=UPI000619B299|nr:hypothetical protein [Streptomyces sp. WM6386]KKD09246.1 hypothetical protein TN53_03840 [Streptomyces sp. WM6386]